MTDDGFMTQGEMSHPCPVCVSKSSQKQKDERTVNLNFVLRVRQLSFLKESVEKNKVQSKSKFIAFGYSVAAVILEPLHKLAFFCLKGCCLLFSVSNTSDCFPS